MSSIQTVQELNPPVVTENPGQVIVKRNVTQTLTNQFKGSVQNIRPLKNLPGQLPTEWKELARVEKMMYSIPWTTNTTSSDIQSIALTPAVLFNTTTFLQAPTAHYDFVRLVVTIEKNVNPMFQGKVVIFYAPNNEEVYYTRMFEYGVNADPMKLPEYYTQFNYVEFNTNNTDSIDLVVDNIVPFDFLRRMATELSSLSVMATNARQQQTYFNSYELGSINIMNFNQLETTSSKTRIPIQLMFRLEGMSYAGRNVVSSS